VHIVTAGFTRSLENCGGGSVPLQNIRRSVGVRTVRLHFLLASDRQGHSDRVVRPMSSLKPVVKSHGLTHARKVLW
jgi:hypothetical protein